MMPKSHSPLSLLLVLSFTLILSSGCDKTDVTDSTADSTTDQIMDGAADQTVDEFQAYVATISPDFFSQAQLKMFAAAVDQDGDGVITSLEFEKRFVALEKITKNNSFTPNSTSSPSTVSSAKLKSIPTLIPALANSRAATILLITADEIADAWKPFAEWKTQGGKATKIITVQQIAKQYEAKSIQEQIRLCVCDHTDRHDTRWVILGGDSLPGGNGLVPGGHTTVHAQEPEGIPTDIVYLSKTNWDADGDGIYGEWEDDRKAISYPDGSVGLGRIPVRTAADVKAFTEKVIAYESRYPTGDFAQQMVYTCTDNPAYAKLRKSWDGHVSKVWQQGKVSRFFSEVTPWDKKDEPGSYDLSAEHLVSLINGKTTGKLHIHGHGHLPGWVLEGSMFSAKHVGQLKNDGAYPLITTVSCNTGEYDSANDPSIVESMIRQPQGGSVAVVAPIRTGKPHFHERSDFRLMVLEGKLDGTTMTMTRYWSHGLGRGLSTGEALMQAKADMTEDALKTPGYHLCICELNLLGDPTLGMRSKSPRTPKLIAPKTIGTGKQAIVIETDAPNSMVCLWRENAIRAMQPTDATGKVTFEYSNATAGTLLATLNGPNLNRVTAQIEVK
ncbi:MAG: C25 family cysteine peptidase [Gimesia sp.]|nr:C25 family cysteine peptidase [Gimesia sp.]